MRRGLIANSVAWNTGMQITQTIGTPNAIWTWMCDDCVVQDNEAYLTDSPGVDGGAYDIDYGNTKNSVVDNYGHDTQGYCVAVFGAGFVTKQSVVRGNLCINNGRSPRMAKYQGAIFLLTWNGGSIDGLTIEHNTVFWNPYENAPALLNEATIKSETAVFRGNSIDSTSPWMTDSNGSVSFAQNRYRYFGSGHPQWRFDKHSFSNLADIQNGWHQETESTFVQRPLSEWAGTPYPLPAERLKRTTLERPIAQLVCELPVSLDSYGLMNDTALQQIVVLKSLNQQYRAQGLRVILQMTSPNAQLFNTEAFRNALSDLDLAGIMAKQAVSSAPEHTIFTSASGEIIAQHTGFSGPVQLGLAMRRIFGEPIYSQMGVNTND
jgi:hypothetical protein